MLRGPFYFARDSWLVVSELSLTNARRVVVQVHTRVQVSTCRLDMARVRLTGHARHSPPHTRRHGRPVPDSQGSVLEPGTLYETRAPVVAASHIRVLGTEGRVWEDAGSREARALACRRHVTGQIREAMSLGRSYLRGPRLGDTHEKKSRKLLGCVRSGWMLHPKIMHERFGEEEYETDNRQPRTITAMLRLCVKVCTYDERVRTKRPASPVTLAKPRVVVVSRGS